MMAVLVALALFMAACGYGMPILRGWGTLASSKLERTMYAVLVGCGVLTFIVLGLGLAGGLSRPITIGVLALGVGLCAYDLRAARPGAAFRAVRDRLYTVRSGGPVAWGCWIFLLFSGLLNLLAALAPISGTDVLAYHLAIPKLYAEEGRIHYVPGVYYSTAAFGLEMLFTLVMLMGVPIAAQVLHFGFGVLAAVAVYVAGVRSFSPRAGLIGATLFYAITDVSVQSSIALIDLGAGAYLLAALVAALRWREQGGNWLIVAAVLASLHAGTKMPNLAAAASLWLTVAIDVAWRHELKVRLRHLVVAAAVIVVLSAPWFLRSWAWTGNPVYPYLNSTFHGRDFSPEASERQLEIQYYKTIGDRSLDRLLLAPLTITFNPDAFRSGYIGPLYLAFLPFVLLAPLSRAARFLLLFGLISIPAWFFLYPRVRTLLPTLGVLSPAVAAAMMAVVLVHPFARVLTVSVTVIWLLTSVASNARYHVPTLPVVFGRESADAFLSRRLALPDSGFYWYDDFKVLNEILPADAVVLLWDTRGYYLERRYVWANSVAQGLISAERQRDPGDLIAALRERGITHVAMVPGDPRRDSDGPLVRLQSTLMDSGALREVHRSRVMVLSELLP